MRVPDFTYVGRRLAVSSSSRDRYFVKYVFGGVEHETEVAIPPGTTAVFSLYRTGETEPLRRLTVSSPSRRTASARRSAGALAATAREWWTTGRTGAAA